MRFNLLSDAHWEAKVDIALNRLSDHGYRSFFAHRDYGAGLSGVTVIFMARAPELKFKQRIKYAKHEKKLYVDIMLDFDQLTRISDQERCQLLLEKLNTELDVIIDQVSIPNFNKEAFIADLRTWIKEVQGAPPC